MLRLVVAKAKTFLNHSSNQTFGHFSVIVSERNTAIGCGIIRYTSGGYFWSLIACNYASTNILQQPVYRSGNATSLCTLGADLTYPGLCKTTEPINPNSFA